MIPREELVKLRDEAEQDCQTWFNNIEQAKVDLERRRGDYRTYVSMIELLDNKDKESNKSDVGKAKSKTKE